MDYPVGINNCSPVICFPYNSVFIKEGGSITFKVIIKYIIKVLTFYFWDWFGDECLWDDEDGGDNNPHHL